MNRTRDKRRKRAGTHASPTPIGDTSPWDAQASSYNVRYQDRWSRLEEEVIAADLRQVLDAAGPGCRVLDVGCGTGLGLRLTTRHPNVSEYVGVDISGEMLAVAKKIGRLRDGYPAEHRFHQMDVFGTAMWNWMSTSSFDVVISLFSPSCMRFGAHLLEEVVKRAAQPGRVYQIYMVVNSSISLGTLLQGRFGRRRARYRNRDGSTVDAVPGCYETRGHWLRSMRGGLHVSVRGLSALAATPMEAPWLWPLDRAICRAMPSAGYYLRVHVEDVR